MPARPPAPARHRRSSSQPGRAQGPPTAAWHALTLSIYSLHPACTPLAGAQVNCRLLVILAAEKARDIEGGTAGIIVLVLVVLAAARAARSARKIGHALEQ